MTGSLIESIEARLSSDVVGKVAGSIGETPAKTSGAISSAVPSIFAGLMHRGSTTSGAAGLLSSLKDVDHSRMGDAITDPKSMMTSGSRLSSSMLGDTGGRITDMLSKQHGIRRESASGIMGFLAPLVAGSLAKQVATRGLGAAGLSELLMNQKKSILEHPSLPTGLANSIGIRDISELGGTHADISEPHVSVAQRSPQRPQVDVTAPHKHGPSWPAILGGLAVGALLIGGLLYFMRGARLGTSVAPTVRAPEVPQLQRPLAGLPPVDAGVALPSVEAGAASLTSGEIGKERKDAETTAADWLGKTDGGPTATDAMVQHEAEQTSAVDKEMAEKKDAAGQAALTSGEIEQKDAAAPTPSEAAEKKDAGQTSATREEKKDAGAGRTSLTSGEIEQKGARATGNKVSRDFISRQFSDERPLPSRITLPNVNFETGTATMVSGGEESIDKLAQAMKDHPSSHIRLVGHTDSTGDESINIHLSRERAKSVKDKLVAKGIDASRIETMGRLDRLPIGDNSTPAGRLANRRTDAVLMSR
ncbi:MAG: DUF937 domain-containing protein [Polyangiaceae bacterium]|nr:DUF937 domain-containing protein [Polyangiaceae bacterium]